jgi:pyruvate,water dikinase
MAVQAPEVLATFQGDEAFPIEWEPGEAELFWVLDDLHCPNPLSPLFFDLGGWWLTCDHMFRRFATPFAADWVAKNVNGYLYTAAIPADPSVRPEANEFQARYAPRVPHDPEYPAKMGAYLGSPPHYRATSSTGGGPAAPGDRRNFAYLTGTTPTAPRWSSSWCSSRMRSTSTTVTEDPLDAQLQFSATMALNATVARGKGEAEPALLGRPQIRSMTELIRSRRPGR